MVSDRPRGDNTIAEFATIRGTLENMGRPQVAIDHSAQVRQAQLLDDGGKLRDAGQAELGNNRREHNEHGRQERPVKPVVCEDHFTPTGLSPHRRRERPPSCSYLALIT
jgi:hypothetical protein